VRGLLGRSELGGQVSHERGQPGGEKLSAQAISSKDLTYLISTLQRGNAVWVAPAARAAGGASRGWNPDAGAWGARQGNPETA